MTRDIIYLTNLKTNAISIIDLLNGGGNLERSMMFSRLHFIDSDNCTIRRCWKDKVIHSGIISDDNYLGYINIIRIMSIYKEIDKSVIHDIALEIVHNEKYYEYLKEKIREDIISMLPEEQRRVLGHFNEICSLAKLYCTTISEKISSDVELINKEYSEVFKNDNS